MFNDNSILAIDIGSKYIKVIHGKVKGSGISLINYGMCETPKETYVDENMGNKRDIAKAISELLSSKNIRCKSVIMGIKGQDIITRHIEMPLLSDKQLKQAVKLDIQQYLSMDPNDYVIDSKKISKIETKEKKAYNVLLVAAPKRKIDNYFFIADKLGLKVEAIDLLSNSVVRFFDVKDISKVNYDINKCTAMIDIGYESTLITIIDDGKLFFERELGSGIKDIDIMLKKAFGASTEEIEALRKDIISLNNSESDKDNSDPRVYYANNNARGIMDNLIDNIIKVFDFYTSSGINKNINCVYLYGGGSKLNGIIDYFKSSINIETKIFNEEMISNIYNISTDMKKDMELYINCISLLLRRD